MSGEALLVVVEVRVVEAEGDRECMEELEPRRTGLKAVFRRRREPVVLSRRGVKDWKRFMRVEGILDDFIFLDVGVG